jgi:hypothetical protein
LLLGLIRVERRANGDASSVMANARLVDGCGVEEVEHCVVGDLKRQPARAW